MRVFSTEREGKQRGMGEFTTIQGGNWGGGSYGQHYDMRGAGIGDIFTNILRPLIPMAWKGIKSIGRALVGSPITKNVAKEAKRSAMQAGLNVVGDVLQGKNVKKAFKERGKAAVGEVGESVVKGLFAAPRQNVKPRGKKKGRASFATTAKASQKGRGAKKKKKGKKRESGGSKRARMDLFS